MSTNSYVQVREENGKWWFTKDKECFISMGINHVDPNLMLASYNKKNSLKKYGADFCDEGSGTCNVHSLGFRNWFEEVITDLQEWKFNTFGIHTEVPYSIIPSNFYFVVPIRLLPIEEYSKEEKHEKWIDIFSKDIEGIWEQKVKEKVESYRDSYNLLGYSLVDIPEWEHEKEGNGRTRAERISKMLHGSIATSSTFHPWVQQLQKGKGGNTGKLKWIEVLKKNYSSPKEAAEVYQHAATNWEELANKENWASLSNQKTERDNALMMEMIAERYYECAYRLIKKHDPRHLVLGDKLNGNKPIPSYLFSSLRKYVDVLCVQWYGTFEEQSKNLNEIYKRIGKPVLLGDSSFACIQPQQYHSKGVLMSAQKDVGPAYYQYLKQLLSLPYVVGWHHCGYVEGWVGQHLAIDPFSAIQCGFKNPFGVPHIDTVKWVTSANSQVFSWHASSYFQKGEQIWEHMFLYKIQYRM
ncbi:hypothetical protein QUF84_00845 [Fictibacillus enclensis]|uniref:hypothetical protein n=1 Tax=Fictibacillus enclensis TaxID=1017270 RepID=UPI0025A02CA8|nr:hypothetical protein [Fictibacillus enclensis]MDM5335844.1 hypothetical protein [Fictibacillus enclensis]